MHLDKRLQAVAALVPEGASLADIGTDHAYLPVWLWEQGRITRAVAGDIAAGPCRAARNTVAMYGAARAIEVRQGSGLEVLTPGEVECIAICGMGGSTIISILEASMEIAKSAQRLVLQPMAGAAGLRQWLVQQGWQLVAEDLVDDEPRFYEIICAERDAAASLYSDSEQASGFSMAEYIIGPTLLKQGHPLLAKHLARESKACEELLANMARSERAKASAKYAEQEQLLAELQALQLEHGAGVAGV